MKSLFSFVKPQIAFGAGGRGGGSKSSSKGSGIKPTGFADQASRMANSQRQLGAPQFPGFDLENKKEVPSVAKRKPTRDSSPIDTGSGGFLGGFQKSPKSGSGGGSSYGSEPNPFRSAFGSSGGSGTSSTETGRLDLSGIGGVADVKPPQRDPNPIQQGTPNVMRTAPTMKKPPMPRVIADDFIPRNPDGSPKYTTPDGRPSRGPSFEMPSRPTPTPGGGKGGGGIARPPKRKPVVGPTPMPTRPRPTPPAPGPDVSTPFPDPIMRPMPTPFPDPRPKRPSTPIADPRMPTRPERPTPPAPGPDMPTPRPIPRDVIGRPQPVPYGGKGGGGPRPTRPSTPVPQPIREFGVPRQGGRPSVPQGDPLQAQPVRRPVYDPRSSTPVPMPMPYGGKGGGSMPNRTTRRPQMPFTYYRPRR